MSRWKFYVWQSSALVEPIAAVLGALVPRFSHQFYLCFGFAAGAMIFVVVEEAPRDATG
jgi:zinc transporter ZupT